MDTLPVELLRLIFAYCEPDSVQNLRRVARILADVGYEYLLSPQFTSVSWRNDIERLHCIALHDRLRGRIQSINIFLGELSIYDAWSATWSSHFVTPPEERTELMLIARQEFERVAVGRKAVGPLHLKSDDLREAFSALPNLRDLEITFAQCPLENNFLREVFDWPKCRKLDRPQTYSNLDAIMFALHGIRLDSFKVDRLPLEVFRMPLHKANWFTNAQSFDSLSTLNLTLDPSGIQGPGSAIRAVNGLGRILRLATQIRTLKLAFHPYTSEHSKFVLSFRDLLFGFTYTQLTDLVLEGVSCDEEDLKEFLARHGATLLRLRLGGRGLAKPFEISLGGVHLHEGTFKSLFTGLRSKLPHLQKLHLEGIFECEHQDLPSHETYNFYPLSDENWEEIPCPRWVRSSRKTINCLPFEEYVLCGGPYPGGNILAHPSTHY